jgi:hypothetical protein
MMAFSNDDVTRALPTLVLPRALLTLVLITSHRGAAIG